MKLRAFLFSLAVSSLLTGCGGGGDGGAGGFLPAEETPLAPTERTFIANASLSGAASLPPVSAKFALGIHSLGGSFLRTTSTSTGFKMISGVGVD